MFLAIIAILLTLILVVGIHELGHAIAAYLFGVRIKKISIGFGKPLLHWRSASGREWIWAMFPLGGYVQLENTRISSVEPSDYSSCFDKKAVWQRIIILLSGAVANLITAWCALIFVYSIGLHYTVPQVLSVQPQSPAAQAGIIAGDCFMKVANQNTLTWSDVGMQLVIAWGKNIPITLSHGEEKKEVMLNLQQNGFKGIHTNLLSQIGIKADLSAAQSVERANSLGEAIEQANHTISNTLYFFLMVFKQLFSGTIPFSMLLGPISVFAASLASLTQGIVVFLFFIGTLSLAVALVNLFPIPGLDGGSIVYALIEKIRGKPVSVAMELLLHRLAFIIFCVLLVHLLMNDLQRL